MKRTLSLVLALVMVLGMIPVYAQAATPQEEAGKLLEQLGVLKGDQNGNLMLDKTLLRRDAVVMLARLLGEEEVAAKYPTAPTWKDVTIKYYVPFLGWAQAEGYYKGYNDAKFGFTDDITVQDYAQVLLRALGYTDVEWKDAYTKAKDLGLLEGVTLEATAKLPRGNMSVMTVTALNTKVKDSEKTLAETLGIEMPAEFAVTAKATGAKKITVTFNKPVDKTKAVITVNKGSIAVNTESIVFADDAKSAVITTVTNLTKGDYTVKVTGLTDEALTATFTAEDVKVSKIELLSDKAPMKDLNGKEATVLYRVLNQYGEEMKGQAITWTASSGPVADNGNGVLTLTTSGIFIPNQTVVYLTGVHAATATVLNAQVTIAMPSNVDTIEFKGLYDTEKSVMVDSLPAGFESGRYQLLFSAKDQYGNVLTAPGGSIYFLSNNPLVAQVNSYATYTEQTVNGVKYQGVVLTQGAMTASGGNVEIRATSTQSGKSASFNLVVPAVAVIKSFTMSSPTTMVAGGETVEIPFTAYDQFGNAVTKFNDLNSAVGKTLIFNEKTNLKFEKQTNGTAKLIYTAPANVTQDTPVILFSTVIGGNTSQISFTVRPNAKPAVIVGLTGVSTNLVSGTSVQINPKNVKYQDQYGRTSTWDKAPTGYTLNVTTSAVGFVTVSSPTVPTTVSAISKGTATLTFKIGTDANSAYSVTFNVINPNDVATYTIKDIGLLNGNNQAHEANTRKIVLEGKLANGQTVVVNNDVIKSVAVADTNIATVDKDNLTVTALTGAATKADAKTTLTVVIEGAEGPVVVTKEITVSYQPAKAVKIEVDPEITVDVTETTSTGAIQTAIAAAKEFVITDQYGVETNPSASDILLTNIVKEDSKIVKVNATVVKDGLAATTVVNVE
ncbi:hypothetical protein E8P77_02700 [Soehngenia saccharolytica]|nr:hypothetical protein E8P77_02700 [Soehngenia saccharolytica]